MPKLTITEAVTRIPVSESTLRRDMRSGKVSFEVDEKGRKFFDVSELTRAYGELIDAEPTNETYQNPPMEGNDRLIEHLEGQLQDLKAQLTDATAEKQQLLELANRLQKQNEVLMLPSETGPETEGLLSRLKRVFTGT